MALGADGGDHLSAQVQGDIDRRHADAAARPGDDDGLALRQLGAVGQGIPGGVVAMDDGGADLEGDAVGQAHGLPFLGDHALAHAADPAQAGDAIADPEARDLVTQPDNDARGFRSRNERRGRPHLIAAGHQQAVHVGHRGGMDLDQDLVGRRRRLRCLADLETIRTGEVATYDGLHLLPPRRPACSRRTPRRATTEVGQAKLKPMVRP